MNSLQGVLACTLPRHSILIVIAGAPRRSMGGGFGPGTAAYAGSRNLPSPACKRAEKSGFSGCFGFTVPQLGSGRGSSYGFELELILSHREKPKQFRPFTISHWSWTYEHNHSLSPTFPKPTHGAKLQRGDCWPWTVSPVGFCIISSARCDGRIWAEVPCLCNQKL